MTQETAPAGLKTESFKRTLSGFGVIILTLSVLSPGVSIFVSGASILHQAGTGAVLAFVIGAFVCYCQTSLGTELAAAYPTAGFDNAALGHALGDWAGATSYIAGIPGIALFLNTSAVGIATYLHPFSLPFSDTAITQTSIALVTVLSLLNIRANEGITGLFMLIETGALLLVAGLGIWHLRPDAAHIVMHPVRVHEGMLIAATIGIMGVATNNASWSLAGATQALFFSEDMKRPETIGRIIMGAFAITVVLELAPVLGTIAGARDLHAVLATQQPFEVFLGQYLPGFALKFVSAAIAIAIFNACLAGFIGMGRSVFAMGRTQLFHPALNRSLVRLIPGTQAPWVSIVLIGVTTAMATYMSLYFKVLILSGSVMILTALKVWAVIVGRRTGRTGQGTYRSPLFPLIPVLMALITVAETISLLVDPGMGRDSLVISIGIWGLAYAYYRFVLMRRPGGWKMRGPEDIDVMAHQ